MANGNPKDEYTEVMQNIRVYANIRFAVLTVFVALTAGLVTLVFKSEPPLQPLSNFMFRIAGFVVALTFWVAEVSAVYLWHHFAKRAVELERELGYQIFSNLPGAPRFRYTPTTYAMWLLYAFVSMFWLASIIWFSNF